MSAKWLARELLMIALQDGRDATECQHCQPTQPLTVLHQNYYGSTAMGLYDLANGRTGASDSDVMFEFGSPFRWRAEQAITHHHQRRNGDNPPTQCGGTFSKVLLHQDSSALADSGPAR